MPLPARARRSLSCLFLAAALAPAFPLAARGAEHRWTEAGPEFAAGTLGNSGQNLYRNRRGELETIRRFDADQNGFIDLLFNSSHDTFHYVPATTAKAGAGGALDIGALGVDGSARTIPCDLNHDGFTDLVFMPNRQNVQRNRSSITIAWGAADGWSASRLTRQLPINGGFEAAAGLKPALYGDDDIAVGDLDGDGWEDIVTINTAAWLPGQPAGRIIRIYWGAPGGFLLSHYQDLGVADATEIVAGRFGAQKEFTAAIATRTGDLVYLAPEAGKQGARAALTVKLPLPATAAGSPATPQRLVAVPHPTAGQPDVLWLSTDGPALLRIGADGKPDTVETIAAPPASHLAVGRLDDDPWPDLVFTDMHLYYPGEQVPSPLPASITILWGTPTGVDSAHPTTLAVPNAITAAVGDLNGDGHGDLAVSVHQGTVTTEASSRIFFGDGSRHFPETGLPVPTKGAQGAAIVRVTPGAPAVAVFNNSVLATLDSAVPVRLFWGTAGGFTRDGYVDIPNLGGYKSSLSDLNSDGYVDLIIVNGGDASEENSARAKLSGANIYWGGPTGRIGGPGPTRFDPDRRLVLPEPRLGGINVADLNGDGYLDVVLGSFNPAGQRKNLSIYYGSAAGFRPEDRKALTMADYAIGDLIVDANQDGYLDLIATSYGSDEIVTFWGSPQGFSDDRRTSLTFPGPIDVEAADLNGDGWLDLIVGSYIDRVADRSDTGLSIFWGGPSGWSQANSQWLPGMTPIGLAVADLDGDGFLDIVSPHYHGELTREQLPAYIYWGSAHGFATRDRTCLVVDSGHDVVISDIDHDGKLDLAFTAHSLDPGHLLDSPIYFNDGHRFRSPRVQYLPVIGPHFMWEQDIGNIATRRYQEEFTSRVLSWTDACRAGTIAVAATAPFGARVAVQVRSAAAESELAAAPWRDAADGAFTLSAGDRFLQYHLDLLSANGDAYPIVKRVDVKIE